MEYSDADRTLPNLGIRWHTFLLTTVPTGRSTSKVLETWGARACVLISRASTNAPLSGSTTVTTMFRAPVASGWKSSFTSTCIAAGSRSRCGSSCSSSGWLQNRQTFRDVPGRPRSSIEVLLLWPRTAVISCVFSQCTCTCMQSRPSQRCVFALRDPPDVHPTIPAGTALSSGPCIGAG